MTNYELKYLLASRLNKIAADEDKPSKANELFNALKNHFTTNKDLYKRIGITGGSTLAGAGLSAGIDKLRGKKVSLLRMLLSGMGAGAVAEGAQYLMDGKRKATALDEFIAKYLRYQTPAETNKVIANTEAGTALEDLNKQINPENPVVEQIVNPVQSLLNTATSANNTVKVSDKQYGPRVRK
jgi:hypothetical protein